MLKRRTFLAGCIGAASLPGGRAVAQERMIIGRMIVSGFRGTRPGDPEVDRIRRYLEAEEIGGVILLDRNISSPEQLLTLCQALREAAGPVNPVISVDQEGGRVARLNETNGFREWRSAAELAHMDMGDSDLREYYLQRARELATVGINLNFGPVLDLNVNPSNPIIGALDRSYAADPSIVTRMATQFVLAHRDAGVRTCLKHFPGHGSSSSDSHVTSVDITSRWAEIELSPFQRMIEADLADSVMMAHVYHPGFSDKKDRPASLSSMGIDRLRRLADFEGPVFTDDMQMGAITKMYPQERAAMLALSAGNSFLIYSNYRKHHSIETAAEIGAAISVALAAGELDASALVPQYRRALDILTGQY